MSDACQSPHRRFIETRGTRDSRASLALRVSFLAGASLLIFFGAFSVFAPRRVQGRPVQVSPAAAAGNYCTLCHSDTQVELQASAHQREGVACVSCHGGDPSAESVAGAHSKNFRGAFDRKQVVDLCASCHSDSEKMRAYGIPTDQRALYATSEHGKKLMQGDTRVAVCTDCHGVHRVLSAKDPASPVFRQNIPNTCGRCHENASLMQGYGLSASVVAEYRQSVHANALFEKHSPQAPDCTRCHGTHGAAPPGIGNVAKVCGQCHTRTLEAFRNSPHSEVMTAGKQSECATCHGNHRVEPAGHRLWSTSCGSCHGDSGPQVERGKKIQALFLQAEDETEKAKQSIEDARHIPLDVSDYEARLSDAQTYLVEARPLSHNLSVEDVEELTRRSRSIAQEVQSEIHDRVNVFRGRYIVLFIVWFYILISIAAVYRYRRILERRRAARVEEGRA